MYRSGTAILLTGATLVVMRGEAQTPSVPVSSSVTFSQDVKPILERSCWTCHGQDLQLADLDLTTREAAIKGGEHGAAIVPGDATKSRLYRMIAGLDQPAMPMDGTKLPQSEIDAIRRWIDQGAVWQEEVDFSKQIQPLMESSCWNCHGSSLQLAKLDLRTRDSAIKGGEHGAAIVPGNAEQSRLYRRVAGLENPRMPMDGTPLSADQVAAVKSWIDAGAAWGAINTSETKTPAANVLAALERMEISPEQRSYWAFQLPVQAPVPAVASHALPNPIDRFVEAKRAASRLAAAPRADRVTLVRRAYLDLLGLPPTPTEVAAFVADTALDAWARLIDRFLASPHYGERYGRHWLDVARYADSSGFENDVHRPNAWRYRDYVIKSLNEDKPYNTFLKEQIAGDELDSVTPDTLVATGFLRAGPRVRNSREGQS